jgi:putative phage-type endonuclease
MSQRELPENFLRVEQGTPEWLMARCGCVTASRIDVVSMKKGKTTAAREKYKFEVLTEALTGRVTEHFVSQAMEWGIENEGTARTAYELATGVDVEKVGFVIHPSIKRSGASPDGLVDDSGLVEIKCPATTTHLEYLLAEEVPEDYIPQMMWQMACAGRQWCDFVSYDPRLPEDFSLFIMRLHRNEEVIASMEQEVIQFIGEVNTMAEKLLKHKAQAGPGPERAVIPEWEESNA